MFFDMTFAHFTFRKPPRSGEIMKDFYTFRGSSENCRPLTSSELESFSLSTIKTMVMFAKFYLWQQVFLNCPQDSGVPYQALGPSCNLKHPDEHAYTQPGPGLGSKSVKVSLRNRCS